jgi:penicillin-binding protein 1C
MRIGSKIRVGRWIATGLLLGAACAFAAEVARLWPECAFDRRIPAWRDDCVFTDRHGTPLRAFPDEGGERHRWVPLREIPPVVREAFVAAEDKRFREHRGVDPLAVARAALDNLRNRRIVSGASTISMQCYRLLHPRPRTFDGKLREAIGAMRMEEALAKDEILEQYLNRVPLGNNLRGVGIAAQVWFGKTPDRLTAAEAATLASMPRAPGVLSPYGPNRARLAARRDVVLRAMADAKAIDASALGDALAARVAVRPYAFPWKAPHFTAMLAARGYRRPGTVRTSLDLSLQEDVERIVASQRARLATRGARQAAVVVLKNDTMELLAWVGSTGCGPDSGDGDNDGVRAARSAGSTLKPFLYARAIEAGYPASTLLSDTIRRYRAPTGDYLPANADRNEYGPITMRAALAGSLNITAVRMLDRLGTGTFRRTLTDLRLLPRDGPTAEDLGLGMAIGNPEVTLERLTTAYAMLANGGALRPIRFVPGRAGKPEAASARVFFPETAYVVGDMLADPAARIVTFGTVLGADNPFPVSLKTGTSTGYRDGWTVGYTPEYTVGVWTGNFDGSPTRGLTGAWGASPIFFQVMALLHDGALPSVPKRPDGVVEAEVCGLSGMAPGAGCRHVTRELFLAGTGPTTACTFHAGGGEYHALPAAYAPWIAGRQRRGVGGGFRLAGLPGRLEDALPAAQADRLPAGTPGVRVRSALLGLPAAVPVAAPAAGRVSIGGSADAGGPPPEGNRQPIRIIHPLQNDRFVEDRRDTLQLIRFETELDDTEEYVDWFVDGRHYARSGPPYNVYWPPERGRHRITAATRGRVADHVVITVE